MSQVSHPTLNVIPAHAGIHCGERHDIGAVDTGFRRYDEANVIPAHAGIHCGERHDIGPVDPGVSPV